MKYLAPILTVLLPAAANAQEVPFRPFRMDMDGSRWAKLVPHLRDTVSTDGFFTIDTKNAELKIIKQQVLKLLAECINQDGEHHGIPHVLKDGTLRQTLATHTRRSLDGAFERTPITDSNTKACEELESVGLQFRIMVDSLTARVADMLSSLATSEEPTTHTPLLKTAVGQDLNTFVEVEEFGEKLEHFHVFTKKGAATEAMSLDWHVDQGLFLLFTPGQVGESLTKGGDLLVQDVNGVQRTVQFDEDDDFVVLLGDSMIQLFGKEQHFRAPVHAVRVKVTEDQPRVWYGRMVLAPPEALHPASPKLTFAEHRAQVTDHDPGAMTLGCSSQSMIARNLVDDPSTETCQDKGHFYCWHTCWPFNDTFTAETCKQRGLKLACVTPTGDVWVDHPDNHNFDARPGCHATIEGVLEHDGKNYIPTPKPTPQSKEPDTAEAGKGGSSSAMVEMQVVSAILAAMLAPLLW